MKKQINSKLLLVIFAVLFIFSAFDSTFAQAKNANLLAFNNFSSNEHHNLMFDTTKEFDLTKIQPNNLFVANLEAAVTDYPKPDFSEMEKWYEIVKYEYADIEGGDTHLYVWTKPKVNPRPYGFYVDYYDKDGIANGPYVMLCDGACYGPDAVGKVIKWWIDTPTETQMSNVKTIKIVRKKD